MISPIPSNPEYITNENIEDAYIKSLIYELRMLDRHEKEFKIAKKEGYSAVGFQGSSILKKI